MLMLRLTEGKKAIASRWLTRRAHCAKRILAMMNQPIAFIVRVGNAWC